jgi:NhaB family Na+:H+ antiporter
MVISLAFCFAGAFLSAFLDALTVTAVIISVAYGFFGVYHKYASKNSDAKIGDDSSIEPQHEKDLEQFRAFLRNLLMHGAVGTALGGVCTIVGEPQNLLIGHVMGWNFVEFAKYVAPVSVPVVIAGLTTCLLVEKFKIFGYGFELPLNVRQVLKEEADSKDNMRTTDQKNALVAQGVVAVLLILGLAFHVAEVGLIGLAVIVLLTTFTGVIEEHDFGPAFKEALPFTALLVVFFAIVAVIHEQHLFSGVIHYVLQFEGKLRNLAYYIANGLLSMISDNVFVATVYINETAKAFSEGLITRDEFEHLAVAINVGTNVPSVATPNGQAAFLFLLTSSLAPLIRLSYGAMVKLALPYTIVLSIVGGLATWYWL